MKNSERRKCEYSIIAYGCGRVCGYHKGIKVSDNVDILWSDGEECTEICDCPLNFPKEETSAEANSRRCKQVLERGMVVEYYNQNARIPKFPDQLYTGETVVIVDRINDVTYEALKDDGTLIIVANFMVEVVDRVKVQYELSYRTTALSASEISDNCHDLIAWGKILSKRFDVESVVVDELWTKHDGTRVRAPGHVYFYSKD